MAIPNPLKVAHVTTVPMSLRYLMLNQIRSIQAAGYQVTGISSPGADVSVLEAAGIRHIAVPFTRRFTPLADLRSLWRLYRVLRRENFTIVHAHNPKPGLLAQLAARMVGVPIVVRTLHGFYFHEHMHPAWRQFYVTMEKIAARCSDVILSQSKEDIATAVEEGICPPETIEHLGNGIDISVFAPGQLQDAAIRETRQNAGVPPSAKVVGFVGRLAAERKGFRDFLRATRVIEQRHPDVYFLIIGDADSGKPDSITPSEARRLGGKNCIFLGHRPNEELPSLYANMDVLVLPSLFEGVPRVVMEAAAMGVPAVVTDVKGNREAVEHGGNGLLVPLGDVQALVAAIVDLLRNPDKARRMGQAGREMAEERFDERLVFARVKREYAQLLREKGLPVPGETTPASATA